MFMLDDLITLISNSFQHLVLIIDVRMFLFLYVLS